MQPPHVQTPGSTETFSSKAHKEFDLDEVTDSFPSRIVIIETPGLVAETVTALDLDAATGNFSSYIVVTETSDPVAEERAVVIETPVSVTDTSGLVTETPVAATKTSGLVTGHQG